MTLIFGGLLALVLLLGAGLWLAIRINGPAVLDRVDRLAGPADASELVERAGYGPSPAQKLRVYRPRGAHGQLPVLVFVHGGSWASGDPDGYGFIARNLAPRGYLVVLAGYRLGPEGRYPAMLEDGAASLRWVRDNAQRLGGDPARIILAGHSAGAYNMVQLALERRWLDAVGVPAQAIRGVVGLAGPYDFFPFTTDSARASFAASGAGAESQPVNHARADAPPMLLVHGEDDTLVRPRNSRALAAALDKAGAPVETLYLPGKTHNDPLLMLAHPWRRDPRVTEAVAAFLDRVARVSLPVQAQRP